MRLHHFLQEANLTLDDAMRVFGIERSDLGNADLIKKRYKTLSIKHHPDHGGDVEVMKDINVAYKILSKTQRASQDQEDFNTRFERTKKEYQSLGKKMKEMMVNLFDSQAYIDYFNQLSGKNFLFKMERVRPLDSDTNPSYAGFEAKFYTQDKNSVFSFDVIVNLVDVKHNYSGSLGGGKNDYFYKMTYMAKGYHEGKNIKIKRTTIDSTSKKSLFDDPTVIFPRARMKKIFAGEVRKESKFTKSDMIAFLKNKLNASFNKEWADILLFDDYELSLSRAVIMRQAEWDFGYIYKKDKRIHNTRPVALPETQETADLIQSIVNGMKKKGSIDLAIAFLDKEIDKIRKNLGY